MRGYWWRTEPWRLLVTDTDPNIATLREALAWIHSQGGHDSGGPEHRLASKARDALKALAAALANRERSIESQAHVLEELRATLAERDRRIAELTGLLIQANELAEVAKDRIVAALEAPPAPAPGELALKALHEIAAAWAQYQRRDISQEEFEGTVADRVELHALPAMNGGGDNG